jgi:ADP-ribosylglycohydrolase
VSELLRARLLNAWTGRISGCLLGKPVEILSMREGRDALHQHLLEAEALPLRAYLETAVAEPDDDINYSVLALMMLEEHGLDLSTEEVARAWLQYLPGSMVFTAEREAYVVLLQRSGYSFGRGRPAGFDVTECADNRFNDWIGAQIRADVYGWVLPGRPALAAELARRDAALSHRGEGIYGAMAVAAVGAAIPVSGSLVEAVRVGRNQIPGDSECADAMRFGESEALAGNGAGSIHDRYGHLSPVHTVNNLALVIWGLLRAETDFGAAIGDTVAAGWDTDCNGATVGGLWGLTGREVPMSWSEPWDERVLVTLAGVGELRLRDLVDRTVAVAKALEA